MRALWNEWDPIGTALNVSRIIDGYDFYFETSFLLLKQATTTAEIKNYLYPA